MKMNERILKIIKDEGITKSQFAKDLAVSPASITKLCNGENNPSAQTVLLICEKYGIRKEWLETGEEPMRIEPPENDDIQDAIDDIMLGVDNPMYDVIRALIAAYSGMEEWQKAVVSEYAKRIVEEHAKRKESDD